MRSGCLTSNSCRGKTACITLPTFKKSGREVLHQLIREHSLAAVITMGPEGLIANHIPLILDAEAGPLGTLRGHVSRMNPQWRDSLPHVAALAIFQGPERLHHAFVVSQPGGNRESGAHL